MRIIKVASTPKSKWLINDIIFKEINDYIVINHKGIPFLFIILGCFQLGK